MKEVDVPDSLLHLTATPMLRMDRGMQVIQSNVAARLLIGRHPALRLSAGRLRLRRTNDEDDLRTAVQALAPDHGKAAVMLRSRQGAPVMMIVLRSLPGRELIATLAELDGAPAPEPATLAALFGLTGSEARVLALIAAGATPQEIAERLALQEGTVRGYLKSGMRKLDARTQVQAASKVLRAMQAWQP